ncbi:MAG: GNAT family N-acetyltransferase [Chloroflexales bacterium]|nr:GNAT family N-acetyltransferase [Chloroflexales bacterium]
MRLFRKSLDLNQATVRLATLTDLRRVSRILREGARRYYGLTSNDLPKLLENGLSVVLESRDEIWATALGSRPTARTAWLRGVSLAEGVEVEPVVALLLDTLHHKMEKRGIRHIYYGGDEGSAIWLHPVLVKLGYLHDTEVLVYEKRDLDIPDRGNQTILTHPAQPIDLAAIVMLDQVCFEPQWTKDDTILGPAISQEGFFIVAELGKRMVGYAYATRHFGGKLIHLVRIAVDPPWQGQDIGVRLMAEVIAYAQQNEATVITLNTQSYNIHAQRLYRWFGFVPTGERQTILRFDL